MNVYIWTSGELKNDYIGEFVPYTPWANTLAWYKLESNANDYSGNLRNGTGHNMTYTTQSWVSCAYFNWSNWYISLPWFWTLSSLTVSLWTNSSYSWSMSNTPFSTWPTTNNANFQIYNNATDLAASRWNWSNSDYLSTWIDCTDWTWHNIVVSNGSDWLKIYVDWVLKASSNNVRTVKSDNWYCFIWYWRTSPIYYLWYISNVIVENKVWTATEVSTYYNNSKSIYWL